MSSPAPLTRALRGRAAAPVRIVHLGLGAFHRAHQAWYTAHADDAADWGIASFAGRVGEPGESLVAALNAQGGLYTLTLRDLHGDRVEVIDSIVAAHACDDDAAFRQYLADPAVAIVSTTVTEAGYRLNADWTPNLADPVVVEDLAVLAGAGGALVSPLARIASALDGRRSAGAGPITVMPCDNMPHNGAMVRAGLLGFASAVSPELAEWIESNVGFVSTSVDRITPRFSEGDADFALAEGIDDRVPVVAEEFADWVLEGEFLAGRPRWETAGARFVDDLDPFENRKLWLLNGSHTGMANLGRTLGLATVADASRDPACRALVESFWTEARHHLPVHVDAERYCAALWSRFENPQIAHLLDQIAEDSVAKLRVRVAPVARAERAAGGSGRGCAAVIAAWIDSVLLDGGRRDSHGDEIAVAASSPDPVSALVTLIGPDLASDAALLEEVHEQVGTASRAGARAQA